jgi:signal transduction histidine kinase/CheY-like chemotaxis protein
VERFTPEEYGAHAQNWAIVQDARDVIYVANRSELLEYDGTTWRSLALPGQFARSLAVDSGGQVYVGGVGEMGYLAPDPTGQIAYQSLLPHVPENERDFADVWTTLTIEGAVYFQSYDQILRWDGSRIKTWRADTRFHKAFVVGDTYFVRQEGAGLMEIRGDDLVLVPGGERFAQERIDVLLPFGEAALLVTRNEGLVIWRDGQFDPFTTEADAYLRRERVYAGTMLSDGAFALTTTSGTVVLMDRLGRVLRVLGKEVGLESDELVLDAYPDRQGGLWLALDTGLLRVDVLSPLTSFGQEVGLPGAVYNINRIDGRLYAATSQGLFRLEPAARTEDDVLGRHARFVPVGNFTSQVWDVIEVEGRMLVAANDGVYELNGDQNRLVLPGRAFVLSLSTSRPGLVYVGMKSGLALVQVQEGDWDVTEHVGGVEVGEVRSATEGVDGSLWLGSSSHGVARVWLEEGELVWMEQYGEEEGLPPGPITVYQSEGDLLAFALDGVFRVDLAGARPRFLSADAISAAVRPDGVTPFLLQLDWRGQLWVVRDGQLRVFDRAPDGSYEDVTPPVLHLRGISNQILYSEPASDVTWLVGGQGLLRYDSGVQKDYTVSYPTLVRRVTADYDNLLFAGAMSERFAAPEVAHAANNFGFTFSAPTFNASEETVYQYWLEGFDPGWSSWRPETSKEYTNLPESEYRFHVRARNAQGVVSEEGVFAFEVLPPWYRTWWAYSLYVVIALVVIWVSGNIRIRQHRKMLLHEQAVNRRLDTANARLREANERLHQADKLKDDFLANTSHELRTPLTAILGFADVLQEELEGELHSFATMIKRGGERLLDTVNALLDMARLQADVIDVEPSDLDVIEEAKEIVRALEPLAEEKGLFLRVLPETSALPARMDQASLERILVNLVGNAIKFTQEGGVTVLIDASDDEVFLTVRDTGIGIHDEFLPDLFEEFNQQSTGYGRSHEGNGLGLAITRRIVHMLGGDIDVESRVGGGTTFQVTIPRYDRREVEEAGASRDALPMLPERTRLLVVEDAARPQPRLRSLLESTCRVDVVVGGDEAIAAAHSMAYDGFLIDGHLGALASGQPVLDALRLAPGHDTTPAVAVTGFTMPGDRERYLAAGFTGYIDKPFTQRRLLLLLESILNARHFVEERDESGLR